MPTIRISDETSTELKKMARPLEDTWDTYLSRAGRFLWMRQNEFLAFESVETGVAEDAGAAIGEQPKGNPVRESPHRDLPESMSTRTSEPGDDGRKPGSDAVVDNYARTEKIKWVVEHMGSWISRTELLREAETVFPETPMRTLNGTIGQAWTDCTNPKYDRPIRNRGLRAEERRSQGVHEKRIVPL